MTVRTVLRMGDPLLLRKAARVENVATAELHALIQDMHDTMTQMQGAGTAGPQIGVGRRGVSYGVGAIRRHPGAEQVADTVSVNPGLDPVGGDMEDGGEGCRSVPGMRGLVPRYTRLHYTGFDQDGNP